MTIYVYYDHLYIFIYMNYAHTSISTCIYSYIILYLYYIDTFICKVIL